MGTTDLRPYVFVARDSRVLVEVGEPGDLDRLIELLTGPEMAARAAEKHVKALPAAEAARAFAALREHVLSHGSFDAPPPGFGGLRIVAKHHPKLQPELVGLLRTIDAKTLGVWVVKGWNEILNDANALEQLQALMREWATQGENMLLKKVADHALAATLVPGGALMGTSGLTKGPGADKPLVPSWLADDSLEPLPGGDVPGTEATPADAPADAGADDQPDAPSAVDPSPLPPLPPAPPPARFRGSRRNFSAFAASAGSDGRALRRAVSDYVRSGSGGSRNARRRMGASRAVASGALGVFRGFQRDGVAVTLRRLNLSSLVGRSATDIFLGLTDVICPDGGAIDEGMARDAWLETVADIEMLDIVDSTDLSDTEVREIFIAFVSHSIEVRLFQDIGVNGLKIAPNLRAIEAFEAQFRNYIRLSVRDSFSTNLTSLGTLSDSQIRAVVDRTYDEAWDLLAHLGDALR